MAIEQYRSQRVFVTGEVRNPGSYALTGDMTLIEALAKAGSTTTTASDEVVVVRGGKGDGAGHGAWRRPRDATDQPEGSAERCRREHRTSRCVTATPSSSRAPN